MATDDRYIRKLQPDFVISSGTQVVLKVAKALPGGEEHKPPGSLSPWRRESADRSCYRRRPTRKTAWQGSSFSGATVTG